MCAHLRKTTAGEEGTGAGTEGEDCWSGEGWCWRAISGQSFPLLMGTSRFCISAQPFAPSQVMQHTEEGPELPMQYSCMHWGGKQTWRAPGGLLLAINYR